MTLPNVFPVAHAGLDSDAVFALDWAGSVARIAARRNQPGYRAKRRINHGASGHRKGASAIPTVLADVYQGSQ